jgi:hypothetical protein
MLGAYGETLILDWGLAKPMDQSRIVPDPKNRALATLPEDDALTTCTGSILGTPAYMSPEQAAGRGELGPASDVFSLGATLYTVLTGRPPFQGSRVAEVLARAVEGGFARPTRVNPRIPRPLEMICLKAMTFQPEARYASARELAEDIERWIAGKLAHEARRRWVWGSLSAGLFLVVLLVAAFYAWRDFAARQIHLADTADRAWKAALGGDLETAEQAISEAERAGASTGQVHMLRGQIALHRGQSSEARRHLEQAVRLLRESVSARGMLAAAYAYDGDWERYDQMIREMDKLTPSTPEDFLFKGYAEANLEPTLGLQTINQAFDRRPVMGIALLLRSYVRAYVAQDTDDPEVAEGAALDARYAKELLRANPAALWVRLQAHLAKAGVHEHRGESDQRRAELELAGKDADALKPFTALPEPVVYRWLYFREVGREEDVLEELRLASERTDHVYVTFCYALTLYRRAGPGDLEKALRVLENKHGTYNDRLLPFVLAEHDYQNKDNWPAGARKAAKDFAERVQDGAAAMEAQDVLYLLGNKEEALNASRKLLKQPWRFYTLRREPLLACLRYNAGDLPEDELIGGANGSRWNQCLAHYYLAMAKLADGDRRGAQEHFDKVIKTRAFQWGPYDLAWVFQARLAKDPTWPRWISKERAK